MTGAPFASLWDALAWLDAHVDFESKTLTRRSIPTLDRMRDLVALIGDPQVGTPTVHITGTNGKGSTAAMVTALLGAAGLSVGTYTSPNLAKVNERIARNGEPIDDDALVEVLSALALTEPALAERPTRFELLTAAALRWFADVAVDAMVVEVGMGGTWDCTNVVAADVAVVTNVSYDHTDVLGPTLEGIAADKAGIVKASSRAIIGVKEPELLEVVRSVATGAGAADIWVAGEDFACTANRVAVGGRLLDLRTPGAGYEEVSVPLHGPHQGDNAACALAATQAFFGSPLTEEVVGEGFGLVRVPGRLEVLGRHPLTLVDGAHNVAGMEALGRALAEEFDVAGEVVAVVGMLRGRDPIAMLAALGPARVTSVVACAPDSPRALPAELVAEAAQSLGLPATVVGPVTDAVARGRSMVSADGMLLVAGSLYVVTDARQLLLEGADRR